MVLSQIRVNKTNATLASFTINSAIVLISYYFILGANINRLTLVEWTSIVVQIMLYEAPFFYFIKNSKFDHLLWITQFIMTILIWGFFTIIATKTGSMGEGANIGLGWLIIVGPLLVTIISLTFCRILRLR